jgi:hypothetical protein
MRRYSLAGLLASKNCDEISDRARNPLPHRVTDTVAFVDYQADKGIVVACFELGLSCPLGQAQSGTVFAFQDDPLSVQPDTADVAAIFGAVAGAPFNPVVVERGRQGRGYRGLKPCSCLLGRLA